MKISTIVKVSTLSLCVSTLLYANETEKVNKLEDVIVTANKIEENLQDVPQTITVIDEEIIQEKGIKNINDIIREIPNMTALNISGVGVNFRGLNTSLFTNNNPIVIYIDGVPTSNIYSYDIPLENIEKIEVLRGPQGTLYGKDAIGGVINIITKKPSNEINGSVDVEHGSNNYTQGKFNLNTPIIEDKLYFNLNTNISSDDGWITNTYNDDDKVAKESAKNFGASFLYNITDKFSSKLVLKKDKFKKHGANGYGLVSQYDAQYQPIYIPSLNDFKRDDKKKFTYDMPMLEKTKIDSQSLNFKYEMDDYNIDSVTVHRKTDFDGIYDVDYSSNTLSDGSSLFNYSDTDFYSQEFRISNKATQGKLRWIAGLYLDTQEHNQGPYGGSFKYGGMDFSYSNAISKTDSSTQALFGQTMIPLGKEFELTLGARYQRIKKEMDGKIDSYQLDPTTFAKVDNDFNFSAQKTWNSFLPKAALSYKISEQFTTYTSISKGYMPGGFNYYPSSPKVEDNIFKPQQSTNYELGLKGRLEDFNFTASLFRMDIKDIHVFRIVNNDWFTDNAHKAYSQGLEFDFSYFLTNEIEISGAFGIIDTKYESYDAGGKDLSGNKIENTPSHTASLGIAYYHPSGFYARTDIHNQGGVYWYQYQALTEPFTKTDGYTLLNAKIGYRFKDFDIYVYGKNLTDEEYINSYKISGTNYFANFGEPRFLGVGLNYKF